MRLPFPLRAPRSSAIDGHVEEFRPETGHAFLRYVRTPPGSYCWA